MDGNTLWHQLWTRIITLNLLGNDWRLYGMEKGRHLDWDGPYVSRRGDVRIRLHGWSERGEVSWRMDEAEPQLWFDSGKQAELFFAYNLPESVARARNYHFAPEHGHMLWEDFQARAGALSQAWLSLVQAWKEQGYSASQRWAVGMCMTGFGDLSTTVFNEQGQALAALKCPTLSGQKVTLEEYEVEDSQPQ